MKKRILFQGDSITDCGRQREDFYGLGNGYPYLVSATLGVEKPEGYEFLNRGVSGNRIVDLYARIKMDFINLKPDYASIYIGVNDTWHEIISGNGVDTEKFEKIYSMFIEEIKEACPDTKLIIMTPFVLNGPATEDCETIPDRFNRFLTDVSEKAESAKRIAKKYNLPVIELQSIFEEACQNAPARYWTYDGVHPTVYGHEIIKDVWINTFKKIESQ